MFSTYQTAVEYLFAQLPMFTRSGGAALKYSLDNIKAICKALGNPQDQFKSIHIAGTNGKGTVSHNLASIYQEAGYKTALFTSPHFLRFTERMKVNGEEVPEAFVLNFINESKRLIGEFKPSFFEYTTAMAFSYFAVQKVDVAIIETGLGGRLDSTNIISPEASVITSISLDHTQFLGSTVEAIANEKAGIIKPSKPIITGFNSEAINNVIEQKAKDEKSPFSAINTLLYKDVVRPIHFAQNISLAIKTVEVLQRKFPVKKESIEKGIQNVVGNTAYIGRWQVYLQKPLCILDVGHNVSALKNNMAFLKKKAGKGAMHIILGFSNDKDLGELEAFMPKTAKYYLCKASIERAMPLKVLEAAFEKNKFNFESFSTVNQAFETANKNAKPNDVIYLGGSFFVVAEFLEENTFKN